jgi:putative endonuclease
MLARLRSVLGLDPASWSDRRLGRSGERCAARMLRRAGYRILGRNVRMRNGEADIVCLAPDRGTLVIVEVKCRRRGLNRSQLGETVAPEASVHQHKQHKLRSIARTMVKANRWEDRPLRIDVVAVEWPVNGKAPTLRHHIGAVGRAG